MRDISEVLPINHPGQDALPPVVERGVGVSREYEDDYEVSLHFASRVSLVGEGGVARLNSVEAMALLAQLRRILDA